jgi:hypothetical protein
MARLWLRVARICAMSTERRGEPVSAEREVGKVRRRVLSSSGWTVVKRPMQRPLTWRRR